jgi:hypothetical protein
MMIRGVVLVVTALLVSDAAFAQTKLRSHSRAEGDVCHGDARRFCREAIPDQLRVLACLQSHRARLSRGCRSLLESNGM